MSTEDRREEKRVRLGEAWGYAERDELFRSVLNLGDNHMHEVMYLVFGKEMKFALGDEFDVDFEQLDESVCENLSALVQRKRRKASTTTTTTITRTTTTQPLIPIEKVKEQAERREVQSHPVDQTELKKGTQEKSTVQVIPSEAKVLPKPMDTKEDHIKKKEEIAIEEKKEEDKKESVPSHLSSTDEKEESSKLKSVPKSVKKRIMTEKEAACVGSVRIGNLPARISLQRGTSSENAYRSCSVLGRQGRKHLLLFDDDLSLEWLDIGSKSVQWHEAPLVAPREENRIARKVLAEQCDEIMTWLCALDAGTQMLRFDTGNGSSPLAECCARLQDRIYYRNGAIDFAEDIRTKVYGIVINGMMRNDGTAPGWEEATHSLALTDALDQGAFSYTFVLENNNLIEEAVALTLGAQVFITCFEHRWSQLLSSKKKLISDAEYSASWRKPYSHKESIPFHKSCLGLYVDVWSTQIRDRLKWRRAKIINNILPHYIIVQYEHSIHMPKEEQLDRRTAIIRRSGRQPRPEYFGSLSTLKGPKLFDVNAYLQYFAKLREMQMYTSNNSHLVNTDDTKNEDIPAYFSKQPPRRCRERQEKIIDNNTSSAVNSTTSSLHGSANSNSAILTSKQAQQSQPPSSIQSISRPLVCHRLGKLVWAKSGSHPWWPGELAIIDKEALFDAMPPTAPKLQRRLIVLYFGETQYDLFTPGVAKTISDFNPNNPREKLQPNLHNSDLNFALDLTHKRAIQLGLLPFPFTSPFVS